jgi:hypothetical protein
MRRVLLLVALVGAAAFTDGCDDKKTSATGTTTVTKTVTEHTTP